MYRREKPIVLKGSASALCNNLSVQVNLGKNVISYAVVHKSTVNLVNASTDGSTVNHRQIVCKEPSYGGAGMILQAKLIHTPTRTILVITSPKGIQMYEAESSAMLYWYALESDNKPEVETCFGRGICGVLGDIICVGTHNGSILVFNIPNKGTNITLSEALKEHTAAICDMDADRSYVASSDDTGDIILWKAGDQFQQMRKLPGYGFPCCSLCIWNDMLICGYGSGHMRVFNTTSGKLDIEVAAHAKWINAVDVAKTSGLVLSVGEDSFAHVWQLKPGPTPQLTHKHSQCVSDLQLQGGVFVSPDGRAFGVTGYDSHELQFFYQA